MEAEKVGTFSCRKSDFIPVFTQTPSITVHRARVIHYLPSRTFYQSDLRMVPKVRWEGKEMILFVDLDSLLRSLFNEQNNLKQS